MEAMCGSYRGTNSAVTPQEVQVRAEIARVVSVLSLFRVLRAARGQRESRLTWHTCLGHRALCRTPSLGCAVPPQPIYSLSRNTQASFIAKFVLLRPQSISRGPCVSPQLPVSAHVLTGESFWLESHFSYKSLKCKRLSLKLEDKATTQSSGLWL